MNFLSSISSPSGGSGGQAQIIGDDDAALRKFLSFYVGQPGLYLGKTTIYIGQLPAEGLSLDLPLPENAESIGSIVRDPGHVEVLLAVDESPEAVITQYESTLIGAGWQTVDWPMPHQAFSDQPMQMRRLCHETAKVAMMLNVATDDNGGSVVRLTINREAHPCRSPQVPPDIYGYLPTLRTPPGAKMVPTGGGGGTYGFGGQRYISSSARFMTELGASELAASYYGQIEALGNWQRVMVQNGEQSSISTWTVTQGGSKWGGYFMLVADPMTPNEYIVNLYLYEQLE